MSYTKEQIQTILNNAMNRFMNSDRYLLEVDAHERSIAARIAMYLQDQFSSLAVDVEFNRQGNEPKALNLDENCANKMDDEGSKRLVIPDIIVHQRGSDGPNLLAIEVKKASNSLGTACDKNRLRAYRMSLHYEFAVMVIIYKENISVQCEFM